MSGTWTIETQSPEETVALGRRIGRAARAGDCLALIGELGSGKTHFAKGVAEGLGAAAAREVTSPTFVLCREYLDGRLPFYHLDAYRLAVRGTWRASARRRCSRATGWRPWSGRTGRRRFCRRTIWRFGSR